MESTLRKMIALIGIVFIACALACCSSGDDDDGAPATGSVEQTTGGTGQDTPAGTGGEVGAVVLPAALDFTLIANATTTSPLVISQPGGAQVKSVEITNPASRAITGTFTRFEEGASSGQVTLGQGDVINATAHNYWGESSRDMTITVLQPIAFTEGVPADQAALPASGAYRVVYTSNAGVPEAITVVFGAFPDSPDVSVQLNDGNAVDMSPAGFSGLLGSTAPGWEQKAHLSFIVLGELAQAAALSGQAVANAGANEQAIRDTMPEAGGTGYIAFVGDPLTPAGESSPVAGSRTLVWDDVSGDADIDTGDTLKWLFDNDWENETGALVNTATTGRMELDSFFLNVPDSGQPVSTGFQNAEGSGPAVRFTNFTQSAVVETPSGVFVGSDARVLIMNGGFDIVFNG
jgi:hypothetical protein